MSSLNPFAARRERKEEQMKAKLEEVQRQQGGGGRALQPGELSGATASSISTLQLPEQSYDTEDLDKYLPASAKVDQAAPTFKVPSGGNYGYEAPSRFRQCGYKLQNEGELDDNCRTFLTLVGAAAAGLHAAMLTTRR